MRCTRCDRIAIPQAVGITPAGQVVFGWCLHCLAEEDCELVEVRGWGLKAARKPAVRRPARVSPTEALRSTCQQGLRWIAGFLTFWSVLLIVVGLTRIAAAASTDSAARLWARFVIAGGGWVLLTSLILWGITLERAALRRFALGMGLGAVLGLSWLALHLLPPRADLWPVALFMGGLGLAAAVHAVRRRGRPPVAWVLSEARARPRLGWWRGAAAWVTAITFAGTSRAIRKLAAGRRRGTHGPRGG